MGDGASKYIVVLLKHTLRGQPQCENKTKDTTHTKLQANIPGEHRCKNPQQDTSKRNPTIHEKDHTP